MMPIYAMLIPTWTLLGYAIFALPQPQVVISLRQVSKCIYSGKGEKPASWARLKQFLAEWEKQGSHWLIIGLIKDGDKLPFRKCPELSRVPCIVTQASTNKMPCGPLFKTCCGRAQSKSCTPQTVWGSTAVSYWYQNQATVGGQSKT